MTDTYTVNFYEIGKSRMQQVADARRIAQQAQDAFERAESAAMYPMMRYGNPLGVTVQRSQSQDGLASIVELRDVAERAAYQLREAEATTRFVLYMSGLSRDEAYVVEQRYISPYPRPFSWFDRRLSGGHARACELEHSGLEKIGAFVIRGNGGAECG